MQDPNKNPQTQPQPSPQPQPQPNPPRQPAAPTPGRDAQIKDLPVPPIYS